MANFLRIPGETPPAFQLPPRPRSEFSGFLALVLFSGLCVGAYVLVKYSPSWFPHDDQKAATPRREVLKPTAAPIPLAESEDFLRHLQSLEADAESSSLDVRRSEDWLARVRASLEANYMTADTRRLDTAVGVLESARRSAAQAQEEVQIMKNILQERSR